MSYTAEDIDGHWCNDGSIAALKSILPVEIEDLELAFFWGKAREALTAFEAAEDEVVRVLEHRYSKGWRG
jgi:hypothetical protein